jgi:hypothetical protein
MSDAKTPEIFEQWIADYIHSKLPKVSIETCKKYARIALLEEQEDSQIEFGDPICTWDREAAEIVANEYFFEKPTDHQ